MKTFTLDAFKETLTNNSEFKNDIISHQDFIDLDNGVMRIYPENVNKYLEKYSCKNIEDLEDTLYYDYGIFCQVI